MCIARYEVGVLPIFEFGAGEQESYSAFDGDVSVHVRSWNVSNSSDCPRRFMQVFSPKTHWSVPMSKRDVVLVNDASEFITAANVHDVRTWIFCYETLPPGSLHQKRYEQLLRDFVAQKTRMHGSLPRRKLAMQRGVEFCRAIAASFRR